MPKEYLAACLETKLLVICYQLQKRINFNCTQTFIDKLLCGGERELSNYPGTNPLNKDMPNTYVKSKLYSDYKTSDLEAPFRALATEESFFSDLYSALGGSATEFQGKRLGPKSGPRPRSIDLPSLYEMRKRFAAYLHGLSFMKHQRIYS